MLMMAKPLVVVAMCILHVFAAGLDSTPNGRDTKGSYFTPNPLDRVLGKAGFYGANRGCGDRAVALRGEPGAVDRVGRREADAAGQGRAAGLLPVPRGRHAVAVGERGEEPVPLL